MKKLLLAAIVLLIANLASVQAQNKTSVDKSVVALLDTIYQEDQKHRLQIAEILKKSRTDADNIELVALLKIMNEKDSINLIKVEDILSKYGWLGADAIGDQGNKTLFLVIQHSNLKTQLKYLPMMQEAVSCGKIKKKDFALLEDRIAVRQGARQVYGSQIYKDYNTGESYVYPLVEPEKVNARRAEVGLEPIEDYLMQAVGIAWDVEKHKEQTKRLESQKEK